MEMAGLEIVVLLLIVMELVFTLQVVNNFRYARKKAACRREGYRPRVLLVVPCKGIEEAFDRNIRSFFEQDYQPYRLWFVVESESDPAFASLARLKTAMAPASFAGEVRVLVAGHGEGNSQKLHNLLTACGQAPADTEALVFADSDACAGPNWLSHIVYPLRQDKTGAASGYRWFVPARNNWASIALSTVNAKVCQLLGNTRFNMAWGGSMAIRMDRFRELKLADTWREALSDDLSLSRAVHKAKLKMVFVPACMIASYEWTTWAKFWEFARRQFIITRVYSPAMWLFGLFGSSLSVFGLWGGLALAIRQAGGEAAGRDWLFTLLPAVFVSCLFGRAVLRQRLAIRLLPAERDSLRAARRADLTLFWLWDIVLLIIIASTAVGRTITWRGIRYRLHSPNRIEILSR